MLSGFRAVLRMPAMYLILFPSCLVSTLIVSRFRFPLFSPYTPPLMSSPSMESILTSRFIEVVVMPFIANRLASMLLRPHSMPNDM